ncbi:arabinogalactan O-methyltransferase 1-like [Magnolia sinica]|uniref:arabinogalactan O-methyltransferase 1-like n=1 Tax=Magnolia sinica TaxID=86752 RepID=UPI00265B6105|nr:arabinogalactan O-methyltransferase 1-like [Magnolia sinica]
MHLTVTQKPWFLALSVGAIFASALLISTLTRATDHSFLCSLSPYSRATDTTSVQLNAILHYATSRIVPQQSIDEIRISFDVLKRASPCNFLVFGLGHDSIMWNSFNPRGTTLFLEEDPKWIQSVLKNAPFLRAHTVRYPTHLSQADELLQFYKSEPACLPPSVQLKGNQRCRLALSDLPDEVYDKEWDLIMVDAPRGYAGDLPGRMGAIFTAATMARNRRGEGVTHVFLHDVDRRVEKIYAEEFLCRKYRAHAVGRLWHFEIPPERNVSTGTGFC